MTTNQILIGVAVALGAYILLTSFHKEENKSNACGCGA
jgi:hypothetical protein